MDDIDRGKIGKKDEKLVGWDHIRKPKMNTNYPPMKAKAVKKYNSTYKVYSGGGWDGTWVGLLLFGFFLVFFIFIVGKVMGFW